MSMAVAQVIDPAIELDTFVAAYEAAQSRDGGAELSAFLPDPTHPLYANVLRELVRIDL